MVGVRMGENRDVDLRRAECMERGVDVRVPELARIRDDDLRADPHHHPVALTDVDEGDLRRRGDRRGVEEGDCDGRGRDDGRAPHAQSLAVALLLWTTAVQADGEPAAVSK